MKKYIIPISAVLVVLMLSTACSKLKVVPEISGSLSEDRLYRFKKNEQTADHVIANDSQLVFFTVEGKILRMDPVAQIVTYLYTLTSEIKPEIIHHNDTVILQKKDADTLFIFDIKEMKEIKTLENMGIAKMLCVGNGFIGYLTTGDQLVFYDFNSEKVLKKIDKWLDKKYMNFQATSDGNNVYLFFESTICAFNKIQKTAKLETLKYKATSGFLLDGDVLYYGSQDRDLVKLSLNSNKVQWKFKLGDFLRTPPVKAGPYVAVTAEDNNIYFFNKRGTLYWWEKFNSTRILPPVTMDENVVVFLWNRSFKFFDFVKRRITTYVPGTHVFTPPVCIDGYIYAVSEEFNETGTEQKMPQNIIKIGNNFGVEIATKPSNILAKGKSIRFEIQKFNLIEPDLTINILNQTGQVVFDSVIKYKQDPVFVWIPEEAEEYKLVIKIDAENKKGLRIEQSFNVLDVDKMLNEYYYHMQSGSNENALR